MTHSLNRPICEPCFKILICVWLLVLLFLISCNLSCEGGGEKTLVINETSRAWKSHSCQTTQRTAQSQTQTNNSRVRRSSDNTVVRRHAVRQARVRIPARHPREALYWAESNEETRVDPRRMYECTKKYTVENKQKEWLMPPNLLKK